MAIELDTPAVGELDDVVSALRSWQREDAPDQLHPGDLGWHWRFGAKVVAAAVRTWSRGSEILAVGFLDGPNVLRMTVAPKVWQDEDVARAVVADLSESDRGVLPAGEVSVELPNGTRLQDMLTEGVWSTGEPWTPLRLALTAPVDQTSLRTEVVVSAEQVSECKAVHQSAWGSRRFTEEKWHTMAAGAPFADAQCLLEPLGVHADHRSLGYGTAICLAAAAHLRETGSSSVLVCTPSSLRSAVNTYEAAGFRRLPGRLDRSRL